MIQIFTVRSEKKRRMFGEHLKAKLAAKKANEPEWISGNHTSLEEARDKASDVKGSNTRVR